MASRMRRVMIDPLHFGTQSGLPYVDDPGGNQVNQPHADYSSLYTLDHSVRIWEPARWGLTEQGGGAGMFQMEPGFNAQTPDSALLDLQAFPEPTAVEIHGIKGDIWIQMGHRPFVAGSGFPSVLGEWTDVDTGAPLNVDDNDAWDALGGTDDSFRDDRLYCPVFIAMYRGTYKQIDDLSGWEIDSGPADDPDTLLGLDISSPSVLESLRIDWWTRVEVPFPAAYPVETGVVNPVKATTSRRIHTRIPMDLSANKRLGANQVLWLHLRTGVVRTLVVAGPAGSKVLTDALYRNHSFHSWNCMSALVSTRSS